MFCLTMSSNHLNFIKKINYIPVGLGEDKFSRDFFRDNEGDNIAQKNKFYGEYTFHYWLWKNYLDAITEKKEGWFGFCQYRKFWSLKGDNLVPDNIEDLQPLILQEIPETYDKYDVILGDSLYINQLKVMKFLKNGFKLVIKKPSLLFNKNKRNINFHFDLMHGQNNLNNAIELLETEDRNDFKEFTNSKTYFNPQNMFICKSNKILKNYYSTLFPWLKRCEKLFGFENLKGFGKVRIYTFLAERFMSYWFQKNSKFTTMPIIFYDIRRDIK